MNHFKTKKRWQVLGLVFMLVVSGAGCSKNKTVSTADQGQNTNPPGSSGPPVGLPDCSLAPLSPYSSLVQCQDATQALCQPTVVTQNNQTTTCYKPVAGAAGVCNAGNTYWTTSWPSAMTCTGNPGPRLFNLAMQGTNTCVNPNQSLCVCQSTQPSNYVTCSCTTGINASNTCPAIHQSRVPFTLCGKDILYATCGGSTTPPAPTPTPTPLECNKTAVTMNGNSAWITNLTNGTGGPQINGAFGSRGYSNNYSTPFIPGGMAAPDGNLRNFEVRISVSTVQGACSNSTTSMCGGAMQIQVYRNKVAFGSPVIIPVPMSNAAIWRSIILSRVPNVPMCTP